MLDPNRLDLNPTPRVQVHLYKQSTTKVIFHENKMPFFFFYPEREVQKRRRVAPRKINERQKSVGLRQFKVYFLRVFLGGSKCRSRFAFCILGWVLGMWRQNNLSHVAIAWQIRQTSDRPRIRFRLSSNDLLFDFYPSTWIPFGIRYRTVEKEIHLRHGPNLKSNSTY